MINLLEKALELLKIFIKNGYEAYIIGGFVRDYIIGTQSSDVDVCTNATPMDIKKIFKDVKLPFENYGSVHLIYKKVNFEITTYRVDLEYKNGRSPSKIVYTNNLIADLKRRDFIINTLCMDKNGEVIDLLGAKEDIKNRVIRSIGDPDEKMKEDVLRILRAVRFATELNFRLDEKLEKAIINNASLLDNLSYYRKKQELNKIFSSDNAMFGINMIKSLKLENHLGINLCKNIVKTSDPIGIWLQVDPNPKYQFTNNEKAYMRSISAILKDGNINDMELYKNGGYVCYIAAQILNIDTSNIYDRYDKLPIKNKMDIVLSPIDIINLLKMKDRTKLGSIISDLEIKIISKKLCNDKESLSKYLIDTYHNNVL